MNTTRRSHRHPRRSALGTVSLALLLAASCDVLTNLCPTEPITVDVNSSNQITPNTASASVRTVNCDGGSLPSILKIPSIVIQQADISFEGTGSGTVQLALVVDGYMATLGTLAISNGVVTGFTPTIYTVGSFSRPDAQAIIDALPAADRAALNLRDLNGLTQAQIQAGIDAAVRRSSFPVGTMTRTTGNLQGTVHVHEVTFNVSC